MNPASAGVPAARGGSGGQHDQPSSAVAIFAGSSRFWFVSTAIVTPSPGQVAHDVPEPEVAARVAERRAAVERHQLDAQAVRDPRLQRRRGLRRPRASPAASPGRARARRANACIQRAVSTAVAAIEPAPPAAVTTDRNGITTLGGATGTARSPAVAVATSRYPIVTFARGFSTTWYHVAVEPERVEQAAAGPRRPACGP